MTSNHSIQDLPEVTPPLITEDESLDPNPRSSEPEPQEDIKFLEKIGSGGFGSVYKARSKSLGRVCAVKVIQKVDFSGEDQTEAIENERSILYELDHPYIIKALGDWEDHQTVNIIFDFESRGDLCTVLNRTVITENQIKRIILDLGSALDYIHGKKIIHRDVKLENILLTEDNVIKLTDFGLATRAPDGLAYGDHGTPHIKAPEVITLCSYTKAVDWWAVGIILYQMIHGDDPFKPTDDKTLEENIVKSRLQIPLSISFNAYSLIGRLLQKKPNLRISSYKELASHKFFNDV